MSLQRRLAKQTAGKSANAPAPLPSGGLSGDRHKSVVIGLDDNSVEETREWVKYAVDSAGAVLMKCQAVHQSAKREARVGCQVMSQLFHGCGASSRDTANSLVRF